MKNYFRKNAKKIITVLGVLVIMVLITNQASAMGYTPKAPSNVSPSKISEAGQKLYNEWILGLAFVGALLGAAPAAFKMIISSGSASKRVEAKEAFVGVAIGVIILVALPQIIIWIFKAVGA